MQGQHAASWYFQNVPPSDGEGQGQGQSQGQGHGQGHGRESVSGKVGTYVRDQGPGVIVVVRVFV